MKLNSQAEKLIYTLGVGVTSSFFAVLLQMTLVWDEGKGYLNVLNSVSGYFLGGVVGAFVGSYAKLGVNIRFIYSFLLSMVLGLNFHIFGVNDYLYLVFSLLLLTAVISVLPRMIKRFSNYDIAQNSLGAFTIMISVFLVWEYFLFYVIT